MEVLTQPTLRSHLSPRIRARVLQVLQKRCDGITDSWYQAIAHIGYASLSAQEMRQGLESLTAQVISFLLSESETNDRASEIGGALAHLFCLQPEILGRTQGVLANELVKELSDAQVTALQPRLAALWEGLSSGFLKQACSTIPEEQKEVRGALVAELRSTETALRETRDLPEASMPRRGTEPVRANDELCREIAERQRVAEVLQEDIAERRRAEEALRESEEQYRTLIESIHEVLYVVDRTGILTYVSPVIETFLGYSPKEAIGRNIQDFVYPEDRPRASAGFQSVLSGESTGNEYRLVTKSGAVRWGRVSSQLDVVGDSVVGLRGVLSDITERKQAEMALRTSEMQYRMTLDSMGDAIHVVDETLRIVLVNAAFVRWCGELGLETQMLGKDLLEVFPFLTPAVGAEYRRVFATGELAISEERTQLDGREFVTETRKIPVVSDGTVVQVITVIRDITQRKKAEEALRESESTARALLEAPTDSIFLVDAKGCIVDLNQTAASRLGRPRNDLIGLIEPEFVPAHLVEHRKAQLQRVIDSGEPVRFEDAWAGFWYDTVVYPIPDSRGEVTKVAVIARDITERKRTEEALRESEERWRSLVQDVPDIIVTVDRDGRVLYINRALEGTGLSVDEIIGFDAAEFALPEYRGIVRSAVRSVFQTGQSTFHETASLHPDGTKAWYATRYSPVREGGKVVAAMLVARDVTERRQMEELKDNLIRDVSHELRTPLAKIQMSLGLLLEMLEAGEFDRPAVKRLGERSFANVERLLQTVEAILDLSALEVGIRLSQHTEIDLRDLVDEVLLDMEPLVRAQGLELVVDLPADLPLVQGDRDQIFRLLINLVDNSLKFSTEGTIVISAEAREREVEFSVTDSGYGIRRENLEKVFERFFQERIRFHGVGVGLAICRTIVEAHGGKIWAESPGRGEGTTMRFALPIMDD